MNVVAAAASAALLACSLPALTQEPRTGVSTPPAIAAPERADTPSGDDSLATDGYHPTPPASSNRRLLVASQPAAEPAAPSDPVFQPYNPATDTVRSRPAKADDVDAGIVTNVPHGLNEFPVGTTFKVRMHETLSTSTTLPGTPFSAELIEPIEQNGQVLIPAGTLLDGHVTGIRGGRRIHGIAALHLEPHRLVLPDGTQYLLHAQVIDTDQNFATRIDAEGTILRRDHIKATLGVLGATTGASVVAGAMIGGGVGAAVGAGIGAGIGAAWWLKQDRQTVLPQDTAVVFSLNEPILIGSSMR